MNSARLCRNLKARRIKLAVREGGVFLDEIVPVSELDEKDCTVEIKQAAGGVESTLFAEEIKDMYEKYSKKLGLRWVQEQYNIDPTLGKG